MPVYPDNWAAVIPLANEEPDLPEFVRILREAMDHVGGGKASFIVDNISKDRTLEICRELSLQDPRIVTLLMPQNRNVMDAYINGFREALKGGHELIIEMDGGLSHDPRAIPAFLQILNEGNDCAFGSRYITEAPWLTRPLQDASSAREGLCLPAICWDRNLPT